MAQTEPDQRLLKTFCNEQQLPPHYIAMGEQYFLPLAKTLAALSDRKMNTLLVGINGCQGSGKSTLALLLERLLTKQYGKTVANLSIDDFYLTKAQREKLATSCHPLFITRGVPGTHDMPLLQQTLSALSSQTKNIPIPRFNKAMDERHPTTHWDHLDGPADIILLEGWCVGVSHQSESELAVPINTLESNEDIEGIWRRTINNAITQQYEPLFTMIDYLIMLKAPDFECVYDWRQKQENKLRQATKPIENSNIMDTKELTRFIEHYQRLTEHMLCSLTQQADRVFELNPQHQITGQINNGKQ